MHWFSVGVAALASISIIVIGLVYLFKPMSMSRTFGLPLPSDEPSISWWLRLKGTRDIVSGLVVFALLTWGEPRLLGIVLAILALIPVGDMAVVLSAKGSTRTALGVHGTTAAVMIIGAVPLIIGVA